MNDIYGGREGVRLSFINYWFPFITKSINQAKAEKARPLLAAVDRLLATHLLIWMEIPVVVWMLSKSQSGSAIYLFCPMSHRSSFPSCIFIAITPTMVVWFMFLLLFYSVEVPADISHLFLCNVFLPFLLISMTMYFVSLSKTKSQDFEH